MTQLIKLAFTGTEVNMAGIIDADQSRPGLRPAFAQSLDSDSRLVGAVQ